MGLSFLIHMPLFSNSDTEACRMEKRLGGVQNLSECRLLKKFMSFVCLFPGFENDPWENFVSSSYDDY